MTVNGETVQKMRVTKIRTGAVSIVGKGAAHGSDAYMLQEAPALVPDPPAEETEYPIVAMVQEHLGALDGEDLSAAVGQIVEVLGQDGVMENLQKYRAGYPSYQLWDAFTSAYADADSEEEKLAAIEEFEAVLKRELVPALQDQDPDVDPASLGDEGADGAMQQADPEGDPATEGTVQQADAASAPAGDAGDAGEPATGTPDEPTTPVAEALTQEAVVAMIEGALTPLQEALTQAEAKNTTLAQALEKQKTDNAKLQSRLVPQSKQPDVEQTGNPALAQSDVPGSDNPYANSGVDHWLKQHFPGQRS